VVEEAFALDELAARTPLTVALTLKGEQIDPDWLEGLSSVLKKYSGEASVMFRVEDGGASVNVMAGTGFCVSPSLALKEGLEALLGEGQVRFQSGARG